MAAKIFIIITAVLLIAVLVLIFVICSLTKSKKELQEKIDETELALQSTKDLLYRAQEEVKIKSEAMQKVYEESSKVSGLAGTDLFNYITQQLRNDTTKD